MKLSNFLPQEQTFWYLAQQIAPRLTTSITTDVVIVGGGIAGLSAAQAFAQKGCKVVLIEKNYCGAGASGKSSGFVTPDSELSLSDLTTMHGPTEGKRIWDFIAFGVELIHTNIGTYNLACDYQEQDTLIVAHSEKAFTSTVLAEYTARQNIGYSSRLYTEEQLQTVLGSTAFKGAISYGRTFGIQGYHYCQGMKKVLQAQGVTIYEETPLIALEDHLVTTPSGRIRAEHIIICMDHFTATIPTCADNIYQVQTFLMISAPLPPDAITKLFPEKRYMIWDTELIYHYYRLTGDNRLLLGGADIFNTYTTHEKHDNKRVIKKLIAYFQKKFPNISMQFEYVWPGMIGVSKDLFPIAGQDRSMPSVYYSAAATGLPWSAAAAYHSAEAIINNDQSFEDYFSPYRSFTLGAWTQRMLGKKVTFALSHFLTVSSI